jgi:hypothetical protein
MTPLAASLGLSALLTLLAPGVVGSPERDSPLQSPAKETSATFKKARPLVGDKEKKRKDTETTLKGDVSAGPKKVTLDRTSVSVVSKTVECREVKDQECVKLRVFYEKDEEREVTNGNATTKTNPNQGKTYIVVPGKKPVITREDGSTPSREELAEVEGAYDKAPRNAAFLAALPDTVKVGDSLDALARVMKEEIEDDDDKPTAKAKVVVQSIGELDGKKIVTLAVTIALEGDSPSAGHMKLDMSGTVDLLVDGARVVRSSFSGPLSVDLPGGIGSLRGAMKEKASSSFSR